MKIIAALILAVVIFAPSTAFGWKSVANLYEVECIVDCKYDNESIDSAQPTNYILLGMMSLLGVGLIIKLKKLGKNETFSITCKRCGRCTRGLKCVMCEAQKQKAH